MKTSKNIVIFGATGNIGAYCAIHFHELGYKVIAVGKRESDNGFFESKGIQYLSLDILDKSEFSKLPTENIESVLHFAGELPSRYSYNPQKLIESITIGTLNILDYMVMVGASKIVFPQTPFDLYYLHNTAEEINPDLQRTFPPTGDHSIYTIAKNAAMDILEHYSCTYGIKRFALRFFTIYQYHPNPYHYGNYTKKKMPFRILMDKAINGEDIEVWGDPSRRKEMIYIKDFVILVQKCIESPLSGGVYNVGGVQVSLEEQIDGIIEVFSPKSHKSKKIYKPDMPNALQAKFNVTKTTEELGFIPTYSYIDSLYDFYNEMQIEPFAKLWGYGKDYSE